MQIKIYNFKITNNCIEMLNSIMGKGYKLSLKSTNCLESIRFHFSRDTASGSMAAPFTSQ